jgi:hypothetical protein
VLVVVLLEPLMPVLVDDNEDEDDDDDRDKEEAAGAFEGADIMVMTLDAFPLGLCDAFPGLRSVGLGALSVPFGLRDSSVEGTSELLAFEWPWTGS